MLEGIDVSRYQDPAAIDWTKAAQTIQFMYAKATDEHNNALEARYAGRLRRLL